MHVITAKQGHAPALHPIEREFSEVRTVALCVLRLKPGMERRVGFASAQLERHCEEQDGEQSRIVHVWEEERV